MSAICGILSLSDAAPGREWLVRMMAALEPHGPDGSGQWFDEAAGLGHQMMFITPESLEEQQPLHHAESRISITFDGRLDNREELMPALGLSPSQPVPDSKLLLLAYQRWGSACPEQLVGEFAFALWDAREHQLLCCTDPMGIRPLFYTEVPGSYFAFASEVQALLALGHQPASINQRRLALLGVSGLSVYLEPESTCFEGISRIPAATVLTVEKHRKTMREYWKPDVSGRLHFQSDDECREAFQQVFFTAVKDRSRSAFPVSALLSGGLDSSAIVGSARKILADENRKLLTLSAIAMPSARSKVVDEQEYIDLFGGDKNLDMQYVSAADSRLFEHAKEAVSSASLGAYSYQAYLYTALTRRARDHKARVILDGDGGELSASGYLRGYLAELLVSGRWKTLKSELMCLSTNQPSRYSALKTHVLRPLFPRSALKLLGRHQPLGNLFEYPLRAGFLRDVLGSEISDIKDRINALRTAYPDHRKNMAVDIENERRDIRMRSHAGFLNYQAVRFSYPFLDKRVLEFCLAVDGRFKYQNGVDRRLLRMGMEGQVPAATLSRTSKAPFAPDYLLRYEKEKASIQQILEAFSETGKFENVVDFPRVFEALGSAPEYNPEQPMRVDFDSQFLVPRAIYLCYFLNKFGA